jgi:alpha-galactosidase
MSRALRVVALLLLGAASAESNGIARLPQAGWNSWNWVGARVDCAANPNRCLNETLMMQMADALVSTGMAAAGYDIVNLSEGWPATERNPDGTLTWNPVNFPSGIPALSAYVHARGLRFGIYLDAGTLTCAGFPGSYGYEARDVATLAEWGVDYCWVDGCNMPPGSDYKTQYTLWGALFNASSRPVVWEASWPAYEPGAVDLDYVASISHEFRYYNDIRPDFDEIFSIVDYTLDNASFARVTRPGQWPLPDMLEVGNPPLTLAESRAHMTAWAVLNSPLHAGNDLRNMSAELLALFTNAEVLAIDRDPAARMGFRVSPSPLPPPPPPAGNCTAWNEGPEGGYNETCNGPAGNIDCFVNTSVLEAEAWCCNAPNCAGFSWTAAGGGSGCYKSDMGCGFKADPGFVGYEKPGFTPPLQGVLVIAKPLADASVAIAFVNRDESTSQSSCVPLAAVGLNPYSRAVVRDVWAGRNLTADAVGSVCTPPIAPHDAVLVRVQQ